MGTLIYILPMAIVAVVGFIVVKIYKIKAEISTDSQVYADFYETVSFSIITDPNAPDLVFCENGLLVVNGIVKNPIFVGDRFRIVDKYDNLIESEAIVEKIDIGVIKKKWVDEAPVGELVNLHLKTPCTYINIEAFLKQ